MRDNPFIDDDGRNDEVYYSLEGSRHRVRPPVPHSVTIGEEPVKGGVGVREYGEIAAREATAHIVERHCVIDPMTVGGNGWSILPTGSRHG